MVMNKFMLCQIADYNLVHEGNAAEWVIEIKYDGTRAAAVHENGELHMVNRRGYFIERRYPEIMPELQRFLPADSVVDGEVCVFEPEPRLTISNFSKLLKREQQKDRFKISLLSKSMPCHYVVFDILKWKGKDLTGLPIEQRQVLLEDLLGSSNPHIIFPQQFTNLEKAWECVQKNHLEGLILKKKGSKYAFSRSYDWLKLKDIKKVTCALDSFEDSGRGFTAIAGNIRVGVGSRAMAQQIRAALTKGQTPVVEIAFLELTEGHNFRQPVFKRLVEVRA
jgi:bifunctional non-homologous end joining protein LigD